MRHQTYSLQAGSSPCRDYNWPVSNWLSPASFSRTNANATSELVFAQFHFLFPAAKAKPPLAWEEETYSFIPVGSTEHTVLIECIRMQGA